MSDLLAVRTVRVPIAAVAEVHSHLRDAGRRGLEGIALWAGVQQVDVFQVLHAIVPAQSGLRTPSGLCVAVGANELHRVNVWLYKNRMTLVGQLHSHPGEAYHSDTDDTFPIATTVGSISIVLPDFARQPFSLTRCAVYRLTPRGKWGLLSAQDVSNLISITE